MATFKPEGTEMIKQNIFDGVSVVVPVYNEVQSVKLVLEQLIEIIDKLDFPGELIVVNDGSIDGTHDVLNSFSGRIKLFNHLKNKGYGAALKTGIRQAKYNLVAITDADGTYPNDKLPELLANLKTNDMVIGSRTGLKVYRQFLRRMAKWFLNKLANYLVETNIPDLNSGFRIFRKK